MDNTYALENEGLIGRPVRSLVGHGHFVSDVVVSSDGQFALSGSWDHSLRLWDLNTLVFCLVITVQCCKNVDDYISFHWFVHGVKILVFNCFCSVDRALVASTRTPRTFFRLLSLLTTVRSFPDLATEPSSCGTLLPSASTPSL